MPVDDIKVGLRLDVRVGQRAEAAAPGMAQGAMAVPIVGGGLQRHVDNRTGAVTEIHGEAENGCANARNRLETGQKGGFPGKSERVPQLSGDLSRREKMRHRKKRPNPAAFSADC